VLTTPAGAPSSIQIRAACLWGGLFVCRAQRESLKSTPAIGELAGATPEGNPRPRACGALVTPQRVIWGVLMGAPARRYGPPCSRPNSQFSQCETPPWCEHVP
jgi:hypothetical protein